jgi:hypothetical protein
MCTVKIIMEEIPHAGTHALARLMAPLGDSCDAESSAGGSSVGRRRSMPRVRGCLATVWAWGRDRLSEWNARGVRGGGSGGGGGDGGGGSGGGGGGGGSGRRNSSQSLYSECEDQELLNGEGRGGGGGGGDGGGSAPLLMPEERTAAMSPAHRRGLAD